jgi:Uma2 family endonuclease
MSSATTDPAVSSSPPTLESPQTIPTLEQLYRWTSEPDRRVVIRDVEWTFYEQLVDSIPEGANIHVDFDGKDLEIMSLSPLHDGEKKLFGQFVEAVAQELEVAYQAYGQTTWKRPEVRRGLESDESYYFKPDKIAKATAARARRSKNVADYPNPDLGIEVDISSSNIDRPGIYAALQVAEVWRYDGESDQVIIEQLGEDGSYHAVQASALLPIRGEEIRRWIVEEDSSDQSAWTRRVRAWARLELAPRLQR